jgi:DNA-binding NarL/FixJ family response regulator
VAAGGTHVDPAIRETLLRSDLTAKAGVLTDRAVEVHLVSEGHTMERIGDAPFISPQTARTHIQNAMRKLQAKTRRTRSCSRFGRASSRSRRIQARIR